MYIRIEKEEAREIIGPAPAFAEKYGRARSNVAAYIYRTLAPEPFHWSSWVKKLGILLGIPYQVISKQIENNRSYLVEDYVDSEGKMVWKF